MIRGLVHGMLIAVAMAIVLPTPAHPSLSEFVQHDIALKASATHVDVTIRLVFFGRHADVQTLFLDSDGDGRYSTAEHRAYREALLADAEKQFTLHAGAQDLALLPLYDPEILTPDIGDTGRFEIRMSLFARLPDGVTAGQTLEIRDGLFPEFPALGAFRARGTGGIQATTMTTGSNLMRPAGAAPILTLQAHLAGPKPIFDPEVSAASRPLRENQGEHP
jgi:hypothetical protein